MAEDRTGPPPPPEPQPAFDKAARQAHRARINRTSRLPFLYDFALRGPRQAFLTGLLQVLLVIGAVLVPAKLITGEWLPLGVGFVVLAVAFALQAVNRYLNAKAGRR